jgi:hypothetical protein
VCDENGERQSQQEKKNHTLLFFYSYEKRKENSVAENECTRSK